MHLYIDRIPADRSRRVNRRGFFQRLIAFAGGCGLAHRELGAAGSTSAPSPGPPQELGVTALPVNYPGAGATLEGYLSRPQANGPSPGVIVIHQSAGLNDPIRTVARRLAAEGFAALAVDLLSRQGGTTSFATAAEVTRAVGTLAEGQIIPDLDATFRYLQSHSFVRPERIGVLGFLWGGHQAILYAAVNPALKAVVVFCGGAPPDVKLQQIQCPVLANYGENDAHRSEVERLMKKYGKTLDVAMYPGAADAVCSDASPHYNEAVTQEAWARTLGFLRKNLS
ncbi:MAG TPA: dienelactone hydrolase family protein [Terriglobia bacterium]